MCQYMFAGFLALFYVAQVIDAKPQFQPVRMPTVCGGKTYCTEKNPDYPEKPINDLLMEFEYKWQEVGDNQTIPSKRQGFQDNECNYTSVIDPIHVMVDENDNLRYVVQNKEWFNQIIYMEECVNPGPLKKVTYDLPRSAFNKNEFECQQTYLDFKFVVLSLDGTKLEAVKMKNNVPVCCACVLKKQNNE